jgi:hypothetical protein
MERLVSSLKKLCSMYSFWQVLFTILIISTNLFNESFIDFWRASSVFIAINWVVLYLSGNFDRIYLFYKSRIRFLESKLLIFILDMFIHIVPVILLGWPKNNISFAFAAISLITWYTLIRSSASVIYGLNNLDITDIAFYIVLPVLASILTLK